MGGVDPCGHPMLPDRAPEEAACQKTENPGKNGKIVSGKKVRAGKPQPKEPFDVINGAGNGNGKAGKAKHSLRHMKCEGKEQKASDHSPQGRYFF